MIQHFNVLNYYSKINFQLNWYRTSAYQYFQVLVSSISINSAKFSSFKVLSFIFFFRKFSYEVQNVRICRYQQIIVGINLNMLKALSVIRESPTFYSSPFPGHIAFLSQDRQRHQTLANISIVELLKQLLSVGSLTFSLNLF